MGFFKNKSDEEKLFDAIIYQKTKKVKSILKKSNKDNKTLDLNIKSMRYYAFTPFTKAVDKGNIEIAELLIDYANQHQIVLNLDKNDNCSIINAISNNNTEMVELLVSYANEHQIILEMNSYYSFTQAVQNNNYRMVKTLIKYANQQHSTICSSSTNGIPKPKSILCLFYAI